MIHSQRRNDISSRMRFLLVCVSCYGTDSPDPSPEDSSKSAPPPEDSSAESVAAPAGAMRRRSRSLSRPGPVEWKPSLNAISEDNVAAPAKSKAKAPVKVTRAASERRSGQRCSSSSSPRIRSRGAGDSYGRDPLTMFVPAFSPTPFMF